MMHGDDVASAGVEVTTQIVSKATEIIMDILKLAIEREREAARRDPSKKQQGLSGGEVTYRKLQEGGEVTSIPSFDKNDYGELIKQAKKMNIPVAAIQENEKENTVIVSQYQNAPLCLRQRAYCLSQYIILKLVKDLPFNF